MRAWTLSLAGLLLVATTVLAGDLASGLKVGEAVPAFEVEKCSGAVNDGRSVGDNFCYRCMLGNKPVVMIFSRKADDKLAGLVKELEAAVEKNSDKKLSSFVNLIGKDQDALKKTAKEFGAKNKVQNVALVVPQAHENGPAEFNISSDAETTVMLYVKGEVKANYALAAGKLDAKAIKSIVADTAKILN